MDEQTIEDREREDSDEDVFYIWPDNVRTLQVFLRCARSWVVLMAPGGAFYLGIRPESMESVMRISGLPRAQRDAMLDDLQVMEVAALDVLNAKR